MPPRPRAPRQRLAIQPAGAIAHRPGQPAARGRRSARACFASGSSWAGSGTAVFLRACRPWVLCQRLSASGLTQHLRHVQAGSPSGQPRHCCRNRSSRASSRVRVGFESIGVVSPWPMAVHRQGECCISRRYKRALTGTANGGRHKAMPCLAEEVLKAPVGQPAFQQLKGAAALYCQSPSLSRSLAARHIGAPLSPVC